ncbi:unnamed protein product [Eruca vesicaria subsp. sativa]|uniref:Uncharacterized protein n=1 Tax=Eruca vesicaria subsp. sativa TaxID=29727 RepID=A0ABC8JHX0_ERUVS|nr:unnamed protein product [Eruca vesicaria subsp. sativa]
MEPTTTSVIGDAAFWLPSEFLNDDDFLVEKENNKCLFAYEPSRGVDSNVTPIGDEEELLAGGFTRKTVQASLEDYCSGGFCGNDAKAWKWNATRSPQSTRCDRRNLNRQNHDMYCAAAAVEELAMMNINGYSNHSDRRLLHLPKKHPLTAAKIPNDGSGYYSRQSLQYQKLQAIQFQQLKQQQLIKHHRHLVQHSKGLGVNHNEIDGSVELSPSAWSNRPQILDGSGMRADFLGKRGSTGTGVFLPRLVTPATVETRKKTNASWKQRSNNEGFSSQVKMEQPVNETRLPSEWAY